MNTPVSFEGAKLLRGKGFSEKTLQAYVYRGIEHQDSSYKGWLTKDKLLCDISAPTITEVVMWLYEKYGIWIVVSTTISKQFIYKCIDMSGEKDQSKSNYPTCISKDGTYYNSPTEAYEAAIEYTLKNLM